MLINIYVVVVIRYQAFSPHPKSKPLLRVQHENDIEKNEARKGNDQTVRILNEIANFNCYRYYNKCTYTNTDTDLYIQLLCNTFI